MMKRIPFILFMTLSLVSCENKEISIRLQEAERLMEQRPDSSLKVLEKLESEKAPSKRQYALWRLLLTQANHKNRVGQTSDSLIRAAVEYFEEKNDKPRLMKAYYYSAVIYHGTGDAPRAQEFYLKALKAGEGFVDHAMLGRIYSNLGSMYNYQGLTEDAKTYQEKAVNHFLAVNDSVNTGIVWRNIGRIYSKNGALDSAIVCYSEAIPFLSKQNRSSIYNETGGIYKRLGDYPKAFEYIRLAFESLTEMNDTAPLYLNLGDLYRQTGQYDSARYYLSLSLASPSMYTRNSANHSLSYLEEALGNYPAAFKYMEKHLQLQDSIKKEEQSETLQRIQSLYNYNQVEKEHFDLERKANQRTRQLYVLLIILLGVISVFVIYIQRFKRINRERYDKRLRLLEQEQHEKTQEHLARQKEMTDTFKQSSLYQRIATREKINDDDWELLRKEIESIYPNFSAHIQRTVP